MPRTATTTLSLQTDPDVRRWYENLARGSQATADVNLRRLGALCAALRCTPSDLVGLHDKQLYDRLLDFVASEERRGVSGSYIVRTIKAGKSWLLHNGRKLDRPIRVRGSKDSPSLREERVPTPEELRKILLAGTPRIRVACSLVSFAGLRPEVLGNYLGTDGLTLGDLPELKVGAENVEFGAIPTVVHVRPELSKNSNGYLTFLASEGCEYVKQYLEERLRAGEKLGPQSDLIHPDRAAKKFIRTINIGDAIRTAIRGAGFSWRPYVLRHYFDTQLLTAESRGKVAHDYRVYWMGHVGSIDARYTTNKRRLPKELVEEMRAAYTRCEPFLSSTPMDQGRSDSDQKLKRLVLKVAGYTDAELDKVAWVTVTDEEIESMVGERVGRSATGPTQQVVPVARVEPLLAAGWEYVALLGPDRAIVRSVPGAVPPGSMVLPAGA